MATQQDKIDQLRAMGVFIGKRDPKRNSAFTGSWMVCEDPTAPPSEDASSGGYCVVGDDLDVLIDDACIRFEVLE